MVQTVGEAVPRLMRGAHLVAQGGTTGAYNELCASCTRDCKQWVTSIVVCCPKRVARGTA